MVIGPDTTSKKESDIEMTHSTSSKSNADDVMSVDLSQVNEAMSFVSYHVPSIDIRDNNSDPQHR